jgi:hypothetical protein
MPDDQQHSSVSDEQQSTGSQSPPDSAPHSLDMGVQIITAGADFDKLQIKASDRTK